MTTDWNKLKVVDLRAELKKRGLGYNGLKQDLVNRLIEADEGGVVEGGTDQEDTVPAEPTGDADVEIAADTESAEPAKVEEQVADEETKPVVETEVVSQPIAVPVVEVLVDEKKRKRRSGSPPPSNPDTPRKRQRQEEEPQDPAQAVTSDSLAAPSGEAMDQDQKATSSAGATSVEQPAAPTSAPSPMSPIMNHEPPKMAEDDVVDYGADSPPATAMEVDPAPAENKPPVETTRPVSRGDLPAPSGSFYYDSAPRGPAGSRNNNTRDADYEDRSTEPALHRATDSLYIANLMRPLKPDAMEEHIVELAAPPRTTPDSSVIVDFWLDPVKSHALIQFKTISAATRVRSALHRRVWPDERNRKELWVDFVPSEDVRNWIADERADSEGGGDRGGRRGGSKWEVHYEAKGDVTVAIHRIAGPDSRPPGGSSMQSSIPTGPAAHNQQYPGIEAAPSGPRSMMKQPGGGRSGVNEPEDSSRDMDIDGPSDSAGPDGRRGGNKRERTRASPSIAWRSVSADIVQRRYDAFQSHQSPKYSTRVPAGDCNRYSFSHVTTLIDRGPETFVGIRPPHREKERRRMGLGPGDVMKYNSNGRDGPSGGGSFSRGGGGGGGSGRQPLPPNPFEAANAGRGRRRGRHGGGGPPRGPAPRFGEGGRFGDGRAPRYEDFRYRPGDNDHRSDRR